MPYIKNRGFDWMEAQIRSVSKLLPTVWNNDEKKKFLKNGSPNVLLMA